MVTILSRTNFIRERLIYLETREYFHRKFWNDAGLKPPFPQQQSAINAWYNGADHILLKTGRRAAKTITGASFIPPEAKFRPTGALPKRHILHTGPATEVTDRVGQFLWSWINNRNLIGKVAKGSSEAKRLIKMPWHAEIRGKTTKSEAGKKPLHLQGDAQYGILEDEAASDAPIVLPQFLMPMVGDVSGWLLLASTPKGRLNHYYATYKDWKARMEAGDPRYYVGEWTSYDNPYIDHAWIEDFREFCEATNQMELWYQEVMGDWTSLSGAIYKGFKPTVAGSPWHVNPDAQYIPGVPIILGIDWGENFRCEFAHRVDGDRFIFFDEIADKITDPNAQLELVIAKLREHTGMEWGQAVREVSTAYCDPSGLTMITLFANAGFHVFRPNPRQKTTLNAVEPGINQVQLLYSRSDMPGIVINPERCYTLIEETLGYERNPKTQQPIKTDDHSCDGKRYLIQGEMGLYTKAPALLEF